MSDWLLMRIWGCPLIHGQHTLNSIGLESRCIRGPTKFASAPVSCIIYIRAEKIIESITSRLILESAVLFREGGIFNAQNRCLRGDIAMSWQPGVKLVREIEGGWFR